MRILCNKYACIGLASLFVLAPSLASAFDFIPTDAEFSAWPGYCKVVYVRTNVGKRQGWSDRITQRDRASAAKVLGNFTYGRGGVHHYCAGMIWLSRAKVATNLQEKRFDLSRAEDETAFTMDRAEPKHPMFVAAATQMAQVRYAQGRLDDAMKLLDQVIAQDPKNPLPYASKATIYYKRGEYKKALHVLMQGDTNVGGTSPDIQYSLGLVLLKLGRVKAAAEYAHKAYDKGYPLPGLRLQLQRRGSWEASN